VRLKLLGYLVAKGEDQTMQINQFYVGRNTVRRMAQRNLSPEDIQTVIRFGRNLHTIGTTVCFLGWRDLPRGFERQLERPVGMSVVTVGNRIITVYRNPKVIAGIERKSKPFRRG
jgi:hypothetical protein